MVPNTSDDLPDPETPVNTVSRRLGISTLMSFRLLTRAPRTRIRSWLSAGCWLEARMFAIVSVLRAGECGLHAAPEEVRESPEHAGRRRKAPRVRPVADRDVGDERRAEVDGEAGVGPLLEARGHRRKQQHHTEELGPRELHPEIVGEAVASERVRHLWQAQLRIRGEAHLQAEQRGGDPEADDDATRSGAGGGLGDDEGRVVQGRFCLLYT